MEPSAESSPKDPWFVSILRLIISVKNSLTDQEQMEWLWYLRLLLSFYEYFT